MDLTAAFIISILIEYWYVIPIIMAISFFSTLFFTKTPRLDEFPIASYDIPFALDRLNPGIDNNRYDVVLSDTLCRSSKELILDIIEENAMSGKRQGEKPNPFKRDQFKKNYCELMLTAVNRAKMEREIQLDYIARTAVAKMLIQEIEAGYNTFLCNLSAKIREKELSRWSQWFRENEPIALKAELSEIRLNKAKIIRATGKIIFELLNHVDQKELNVVRESNFGPDAILPEDLFLNPLFHAEKTDDYFMMDAYDILPGQRIDDTDNPTVLLATLKNRFIEILSKEKTGNPDNDIESDNLPQQPSNLKKPSRPGEDPLIWNKKVDSWIKEARNVNILFDFISTRKQYLSVKNGKGGTNELSALRQTQKKQLRMLMFFYKKLDAEGTMKRILASYEIRSIYPKYCPPLVPQVILQFMTIPGTRKVIINRLKHLSKMTCVPYPTGPLKQCQKRIKRLSSLKKKEYLIRFFKGFFRYHRDLENFKLMKEAMDMIRLMNEENHIRLSRANNTLYDFLLPQESDTKENSVIRHAILKADVRGSTDIVNKMKEQGLNPASYFSLNMFDPITEIIPYYGAFKVFIEGDAMILGIYEKEKEPDGWYSIARACGLAIEILMIIRRYNEKNRKHNLPLLEIGIGITFHNEPPALFFDGDFQIMISPAINLADRLSGCSKFIRKKMEAMDRPFNVYVFQTESNEEVAATTDEISTRYNVNGIELHPKAFEKLSREIKLRSVECLIPEIQPQQLTFFTGIFPTATGRYKRLIIREGIIPHVYKHNLKLISMTYKKYYEVITNTTVYNYFKKNDL